MSAYGKLNY